MTTTGTAATTPGTATTSGASTTTTGHAATPGTNSTPISTNPTTPTCATATSTTATPATATPATATPATPTLDTATSTTATPATPTLDTATSTTATPATPTPTTATLAPGATTATMARAGRIISGLAIAFLLFDAVIHVLAIEPVVESFQELGFPASSALGIGILELACLALYAIPRTSVLGAMLLTGYLGGAVCAHVRVDSPLLSTTLFPVYVGIAVWAGLYLRNAKLRALLAH